jgi:NAD(P)-dependent dehydrogenase (short-subunit alcohol dehydrogenase family)
MSSTAGTADRGHLAGKVALITGGSRGIGFECARVLHAEGMTVMLIARDRDALRAAADRLGSRARYVSVDLAGDLVSVAREIRLQLQTVPEILVNNAAEFFVAPAEDTGIAAFEHALRVNLS